MLIGVNFTFRMQWQELRTHLRHLPERDLQRIEKAFQIGRKAHDGQKRKSGEPYFSHPIAVAHMLADIGSDADTIIAALLHDTLEDTPLTDSDVREVFDSAVTDLIQGVTKLNKADLKHPAHDEQLESLRKIFTLMQGDVRIMVIKLIDRLHNMQTAEFLAEDRRKLLAKETREVYAKIADRLCMQDVRDDLDELCLSILDPDQHALLSQLRIDNEKVGRDVIRALRVRLTDLDQGLVDRTRMVYEHKSWEKLEQQQRLSGEALAGTSDHAIVFVVPDEKACYLTLGLVHQLWKRVVGSFQDFINVPLINGYRALHTTVILDDGSRIRCKIRTEEMDRFAHAGVSMLCFGDRPKALAEYFPWALRLSPLTEDTRDHSREFWESLQSDILGESIVVYGPAGGSVSLPSGATALDAAFALVNGDALRISGIRVNGQPVKFLTPVKGADVLSFAFADGVIADRSWLNATQTSAATAAIRSSLSTGPESSRAEAGKRLLQKVFTERQKGFIDEVNDREMQRGARALGYDDGRMALIAIADGRLEPDELYDAVFDRRRRVMHRPRRWMLSYIIDPDDLESMRAMNEIHSRYRKPMASVRYIYEKSRKRGKFRIMIDLTTEQSRMIVSELRQAGATTVRLVAEPLLQIALTALVILLWGLDAVCAKYLLGQGIDPMAFTFIRAWAGLGFAIVLLAFLRARSVFSRIPIGHPMLWISGVAFFLVNLFTQLTLQEASPFYYKTSLRLSVFFLAVPLLWSFGKFRRLCAALVLGGFGVILLLKESSHGQGFFLSACMALAFALYTASSASFQKSAHIDMRYPQFFFAVSAISAGLSLLSLIWHPFVFPPLKLILEVALFTVVFVCVPYILFYRLMRTMDYVKISPYFHASILITFLAQWAWLGIQDLYLLPAAAALVIAGLIMTSNAAKTPGS